MKIRAKRKICTPLAAVLCAAALLAGCGFHEKSPAATTPAPTTGESKPDKNNNTEENDLNITEKALSLLRSMTLEEKVGQLFIVRCPQSGAAEAIESFHLGGFTLYGVDFKSTDAEEKTPASVTAAIKSYQDASTLPMFIAIDEEGGTVVRASLYEGFRSEPFRRLADIYADGGIPALVADTADKCEFLSRFGINVNFAPVCDFADDPSAYIYKRTMQQSVTVGSECIAAVVAEMNRLKMGCSLKHFPGYGNNINTHDAIAVDSTRTVDDFRTVDYLPFRAGIDAGASMVMVTHIIINCLDPDLPASLSPKVNKILREELGYEGVIVTDSLDMDAITKFTGGSEAAVAALLAGNDLLCCSSFRTQIPAVLAALSDGTLTEARIDESVLRILRCKLSLGIID